MQTYSIKRATIDDIEWIAKAQVAMALETENMELDLEKVIKGVRYFLDNPKQGFYVMGNNNNDPVSCLLIQKEWSDWRNTEVWWIHGVYVTPSQRGKGLFSKMFNYIKNLAESSNVSGLRLYVEKTNLKAQAIYKKTGMTNEHYELFEKMF